MKISTRNQLKGKVFSVTEGAVNSEIIIQLRGGTPIVSVITNGAVESLGLREGKDVIALVKSSNVMLGIGIKKISARNVLCGTIVSVTEGVVNTGVVVDLGNGCLVTSVITKTSAHKLELAEGVEVCAIIKASSVIIATEE